VVVAGAFYGTTHSVAGTAACLASGVLIDLDHLLDYVLARRKLTFDLAELEHFCGKEKFSRLYILFHSYEFLALLWLAIWFWQLNFVWQGVAWGVTLHLVLDQFVNPLKPLVYFFTYRLKHGFDRKCVFPDEYYNNLK